MGVGPANQDEDDSIHRARAGRTEVSELLADLAVDPQGRNHGANEAKLEERLLRCEVGPDGRGLPCG